MTGFLACLAWKQVLRASSTFELTHLVNGVLVQLDQAFHHLPTHYGEEEAQDEDHGGGRSRFLCQIPTENWRFLQITADNARYSCE